MIQKTTSPSNSFFAVTPNDSTNLANGECRGIYVGVSGDVSVLNELGTTTVLVGVLAGVVHPFGTKRIRATGTTATNIIAVY